MKSTLNKFTIILFLISVFVSCSKKDDPDPTPTPNPNPNTEVDSVPPVIILLGLPSMTISLNSVWTDPGATASDAHDGTVNVTSNASSSNPNVNLTGTYTVIYTASDSTGNTDSTSRIITVVNDAASFEGTYTVTDDFAGFTFYYNETITADNTINNKINFNRFCDMANNTAIYAMRQANGSLSLPLQTAVDIGTYNGGPCDIATHTFQSTSYTQNANGFVLNYIDAITAPSSCIASNPGMATYVR